MKAYKIEAIGKKSDYLFDTMTSVFEYVDDIRHADVVLFDLYSGLGAFDNLEMMKLFLYEELPIVYFDFTDYGSMSQETWTRFNHFPSKKFIKFIRKMDNKTIYPPNYYPIEVCQYPTHGFTPVSKEELFNRPIDITFIGNTSPQRESVCNGLSEKFKCDFVLGEERIPNSQWVDIHRLSKLFISSDGGGFGDERPYQLITISPMLRQRNNHLQIHPFANNINCLEVSEHPLQEEIQNIKETLALADKLYDIYKSGIDHMKKHYSFEARANYILETINQSGICH